MARINKAAQTAAVTTLLADNTNEGISPEDERIINQNIIDSVPFLDDVASITGVYTFTANPIVPEPTSGNHATTKDYVDLLVSGILEPLESVADRFNPTSATPSSPSTGDRYISTATANGWTEHNIYEWDGAAWDETVAVTGQSTLVDDEDILYLYNGTLWVKFGSTVPHNSLNSLQGGTTDEYYHMTSAQNSGFLIKSSNETVSGAWTFSGKSTHSGGIAFLNTPITTAVSRPMTADDNCYVIGVTAASTQTLPNSANLTAGWNVILDNQIEAGGTVTINKNAADSTGIIKHEGASVDAPLIEGKYTAATIWWDGASFHVRGAIT